MFTRTNRPTSGRSIWYLSGSSDGAKMDGQCTVNNCALVYVIPAQAGIPCRHLHTRPVVYTKYCEFSVDLSRCCLSSRQGEGQLKKFQMRNRLRSHLSLRRTLRSGLEARQNLCREP